MHDEDREAEAALEQHEHCLSLLWRIAKDKYPEGVLFRREYHRWALYAPATLSWQQADGSQQSIKGAVDNIGGAGIGLLCPREAPVGEFGRVVVHAADDNYEASIRVTHCTKVPEGFRLGCTFTDD